MRQLIAVCFIAMCSLSWVGDAAYHARGATLHTDDFQTDLGGWTSGGATLSRVITGGPAGAGDGFARLLPVFKNFAAYNSTPNWTGDLSSIGAAEVTADLMAAVGSDPLAIRLVLFGPGFSPNTSPRWTSTVAVDVPADGVWRNYTFSLAEADLTRVLGTGTYQNLMTGVLRVMLRHDPGAPNSGGTPVDGDLGIDNVTLRSATVATPGDFNSDGVVDGADFLAWQRGQSPRPRSPDDLLAWQTHFGSATLAEVAHVVPEPTGGYFLGLLALSARSRLRRLVI